MDVGCWERPNGAKRPPVFRGIWGMGPIPLLKGKVACDDVWELNGDREDIGPCDITEFCDVIDVWELNGDREDIGPCDITGFCDVIDVWVLSGDVGP